MFSLSNVTEDKALIFFPFFSLCNFWFFSLPLLGFAPPSPSFSHPTTQIWQLHATFTVISAAPHLFLFCLQTVIKPEGGQSVSWAIHSSSYRQPQGRGSSCGTQGGAPGRSNLEEDFGEQAAGLAGWGLATSGQEQTMHEKEKQGSLSADELEPKSCKTFNTISPIKLL